MEDLESIKKQIETTRKEIKDSHYYDPNDDLITKYITCHNEIRKLIGGSKAGFVFKLENKQYAADKSRIKEIVKILNNLSDGALDSKISAYFDISAENALALPTIVENSHLAHKTIKYINLCDINFVAPKDKVKWSNTVNELTLLWKRGNTKSEELDISISIEPEAFLNIGNYEIDKDSCFRPGKQRSEDRYSLMHSENSFVLIITSKKKIVGRMWGFYCKSNNTMNFCNFYFAPKTHEGNIIECLKFLSANLLKLDFDDLVVSENNIIDDDKVYLNPYFRITIGKKEKPGSSRMNFYF